MMSLTNTVSAWSQARLADWQSRCSVQWPQAFQAWKRDQMDRFLKCGFPGRRDEDWQHTDITPIINHEFIHAESSSHVDINPFIIPNAYRIVFVDGAFRPDLSLLSHLPRGVWITDTAKAITDHHEPSEWTIASAYENAFSLLNDSLCDHGVWVHVEQGVQLDQPIHCLYVHANAASSIMTHPRHRIRIDSGSRVSLIEDYVSLSGAVYWNNIVMQMTVLPEASLCYYKLQRESSSAFHTANTIIEQHRSSDVKAHQFSMGARLGRDHLSHRMTAPRATCRLLGLYYPAMGCHLDHQTYIDHQVPETSSDQLYKGLIGKRSSAVFNGKIIVHPGASQTSTEQLNHNLLLSPDAVVHTKPSLTIDSDNVVCSHGATVGQMDDHALFYLQSRGIPAEHARALLTYGFASDILDQLPDPVVAQHIQSAVFARFSGQFNYFGGGDGLWRS